MEPRPGVAGGRAPGGEGQVPGFSGRFGGGELAGRVPGIWRAVPGRGRAGARFFWALLEWADRLGRCPGFGGRCPGGGGQVPGFFGRLGVGGSAGRVPGIWRAVPGRGRAGARSFWALREWADRPGGCPGSQGRCPGSGAGRCPGFGGRFGSGRIGRMVPGREGVRVVREGHGRPGQPGPGVIGRWWGWGWRGWRVLR